jgi:hypothetical protein
MFNAAFVSSPGEGRNRFVSEKSRAERREPQSDPLSNALLCDA